MKKPVEHKCVGCGNVYYYRGVKLSKRCPVCRSDLMPKGYEYRRWPFGGGHVTKMPIIPPPPKKRPEIVCLCGPMRFHDAYRKAEYELELAGKIVLAPSFKPGATEHDGTTGCTPEQKIQLDALHKEKIKMADRVLILNVGGYVGESTRSEIEHAKALGKAVDFLEN